MRWVFCCRQCASPVRSRRVVGDTTALVTCKGHEPEDKMLNFYVPVRYSSLTSEVKYRTDVVQSIWMDDSVYHKCRSLSSPSTDSEFPLSPSTETNIVSLPPKTTWKELNTVSAVIGYDRKDIVSEIDSFDCPGSRPTTITDDGDWTLGFVKFTTVYDVIAQIFTIHVEGAMNLPSKYNQETYDTVTRVALVPSKKNCQRSKRIRKSLNPQYQEDFKFPMDPVKKNKVKFLKISVYDYERQGQYDAIGHVLLHLPEELPSNATDHFLPLRPMSLPVSDLGEVLLSLCYIPSQARLSVKVVRGRNLRMDPIVWKNTRPSHLIKNCFDSYVKVTLMCGGEKIKTKRTQVISNSRNPVYDRSFHYIVPPAFVDDSSVLVSVLTRGSLQQSSVLGRVMSGPYSTSGCSQSLTHWGQMIKERKYVTRWRTLCL